MSEDEDTEQVEENDMMNMFASVWVKVEVDDDRGNYEHELKASSITLRDRTANNQNSTKKRRHQKKNLQCDLCDYTTAYKNCLEIHVLGHNNSKPFSCTFCEYTTRYPTSLHRHTLIQHEFKKDEQLSKDLPIHKCDECSYTSFFKWNLNAHKRKHKPEKQFKCEHCTYATAYRHNYVKHSKVHNKQEVVYKCDKCPFITKFEGHITRHLAKIHNEVTDKANRCDFCDFSTKTRWRLNIHKQRSRRESPVKCNYCDFETVYMCESKKHKVGHYDEIYGNKGASIVSNDVSNPSNVTNNDLAGNPICYSTVAFTDVTKNMTRVNEPANYDDFNESFPLNDTQSSSENDNFPESSQRKHEKNNHYSLDPNCEVDWNSIPVIESAIKERPFQCTMCKYTSKFKASVQRHYQRHHTSHNRPYKCSNCDFSTKTKDQIALHNKRSQSDQQIICNICKFATYFKCQYVMHQKCHYAHKCSICNYTCKHKYEIQKHFSTIHLGYGWKCRFCDYKATRKEGLLCHETIHTGNKPFKCSFCNYMSVRKSLLDNHLKRHHSVLKKDLVVVSESKIQSLKIVSEQEKIEESELIKTLNALNEFETQQHNLNE